jgi:hypothetical protein
MAKTKMLVIRVTEEQDQKLQSLTLEAGYAKKSEYIRSTLFRNKTMEEKINQIHKKVCA